VGLAAPADGAGEVPVFGVEALNGLMKMTRLIELASARLDSSRLSERPGWVEMVSKEARRNWRNPGRDSGASHGAAELDRRCRWIARRSVL